MVFVVQPIPPTTIVLVGSLRFLHRGLYEDPTKIDGVM